ncbi:YceI family protein [Persicobacter psychrovividus]|uniref:Lipid-binding protein n=1 Tax=Persicobacter psychrovividus TaxID=387638 RepID=A0ABM7VH32_9BACT|nr:lipid-binding protein [Persicobacter psychrovividus]
MRYHILVLLLAMSSLLTAFALSNTAEQYTVDTDHSQVKWTGEKVGGSHYGHVAVKEGVLHVADGKIESGLVVLDMSSMVVEDLKGFMKRKLEKHLKSEDFFNVEAYPTATFKIKKVYRQGKQQDEFKVIGDLTIKGITKEIHFPATIALSPTFITAKALITVDRTAFDVRYGSGSFFDDLGNKTIYDDFKLEVNIKANQK